MRQDTLWPEQHGQPRQRFLLARSIVQAPIFATTHVESFNGESMLPSCKLGTAYAASEHHCRRPFPALKSTIASPGPTIVESRQWRWRLNAPDRRCLSERQHHASVVKCRFGNTPGRFWVTHTHNQFDFSRFSLISADVTTSAESNSFNAAFPTACNGASMALPT